MKMKMDMKNAPAPDMENEKQEGDSGVATPKHENAETGAKEHQEDMNQDASEEDYSEEDGMGEMMGMSQAECDAHDLMRAAEIKMDSARLGKAMEIISKKKEVINSMEDLMAVRKEKMLKGK
jgi:hypothetical protein